MDSGGWVAVLVLGAGLAGLTANEVAHRVRRHDTLPTPIVRVSWRSLQALEQAITEEAHHDTEVWQ